MQPLDLLHHAEELLAQSGRLEDVHLRRATSATYYAIFHCVALDTARLFIGAGSAARKQPAWQRVYRALQHGFAKNQCIKCAGSDEYGKEIKFFAAQFVTMQLRRQEADYNPNATFDKEIVQIDVSTTRDAIAGYLKAPAQQRRAFCAHLLFSDPGSR